ncbi:cytochrome o ubiquinol/quinol oxidase subunit IV [Thioclava sp. JE_KL1]|uniref:cytochrome o ubiquinol oxidase subunit IV n=1 Tax=Thioclava sp. JE_KL1 TaxID=2651187 RepID=UPI00128B94A9|nr:cytochrome C oxidase subunit IV family protein [Thioclava sp. JE_KL1]MPQ95319.1 cytochrome-c oxidase [Thioclava sp. JE_KL1]
MSAADEKRREARSYLIGYALALALTLPIFALVAWDLLPKVAIWWATGVAAIVQIVVHFRFFLHIRLKGQKQEDLHLILFTTLILLLMGGGTLWLLWNLHARMM